MTRTVRDVQIVVEAMRHFRDHYEWIVDNVKDLDTSEIDIPNYTRLNAEIARLCQSDRGRAPNEPSDWQRYYRTASGWMPNRLWRTTP